MEISVTVPNGSSGIAGISDSKVTLRSPRFDDKNFYPVSNDSESDNDVLLSGYKLNGDQTKVNEVFAQNNVKLAYNSPVTQRRNFAATSDSNISDQDTGAESDYSLKSQHRKIIQSKMSSDPFSTGDPWSMALPPPLEFSDDTGLTSETTDDENVPLTNIDDILTGYAPSLTNNNLPENSAPNKNEQQLQDLMNLDEKSTSHNDSLSLIPEEQNNGNVLIQNSLSPANKHSRDARSGIQMNSGDRQGINEQNKIMDVFDSYLTSEDEFDGRHILPNQNDLDQRQVSLKHLAKVESKHHYPPSEKGQGWEPSNQVGNQDQTNSCVYNGMPDSGENIMFNNDYKVLNSSRDAEDDDIIVPISVKREMSENANWKKFDLRSHRDFECETELPDSHVDEEVIIASVIPREKKVALNQTRQERSPSPPKISPRAKMPQKPQIRPRKGKPRSSDSEESVEESIIPVQLERVESSKILEEKLGTDIEEPIVAEVAKKEQVWNGVQLVVMTNKWSKSAKDKKDANSNKLEDTVFKVLNPTSSVKGNSSENDTVKDKEEETKLESKKENIVTINLDMNVESRENNTKGQEFKVSDKDIENFKSDNTERVTVSVVNNTSNESMNTPTDPKEEPVKSVTNISVSSPRVSTQADIDENIKDNEKFVQSFHVGGGDYPQPAVQIEEPVKKAAISQSFSSPIHVEVETPKPSKYSPGLSPRGSQSSPISSQSQESNSSIEHVSPSPVTSPVNSPRSQTSTLTSPRSQTSPVTSPRSQTSPLTSPTSGTDSMSPASSPIASLELPSPRKPELTKTMSALPESTGSKQQAQYKTSVAVTKPSLLSTIRTQNSNQMKPLSSIKPVKIDSKALSLSKPVKYSTKISTTGKPSLLSTLHGSALSGSNSTKSSRVDDGPFQVSVLKGILGLGMKVQVTADTFVQVTEVQSSGPIAKDGNIRVGDYILAINSTELTGLQDSKVQQILRLLPRGLAKITASVLPPSDICTSAPEALSEKKEIKSNEESVKEQTVEKPRPASLTIDTSPEQPKSAPSPASPANQLGVRISPKPFSSTTTKPQSLVKSPVTGTLDSIDTASPKLPEAKPPNLPAQKAPEVVERPVVSPREEKVVESKKPSPKKAPPPIAPKPKIAEKPSRLSDSSSDSVFIPRPQTKGYVSSAAEKRKPVVETVEAGHSSGLHSSPPQSTRYSAPVKLSSPTEKPTKPVDPNAPIDTVIFASIGNKTDYISSAQKRHSGSPRSSDDGPEPQLIPSGHVDYVTPANKPQRMFEAFSPSTGPSSQKSPTSPTAKKLNSALSPRKPSSGTQFGFSVSPKATSPTSPEVKSQHGSFGMTRLGKDEVSSTKATSENVDVVEPSPDTPNVVTSSPVVECEPPINVVSTSSLHVTLSSQPQTFSQEHKEKPQVQKEEKQPQENEQKQSDQAIELDDVQQLSEQKEDTLNVLDLKIDPRDKEEVNSGAVTEEGKDTCDFASVEVVHEENGTKTFSPDFNPPAYVEDISNASNNSATEKLASELESSSTDKPESELESSGESDGPPPLPPMSTMPVAYEIAKQMVKDEREDVSVEEDISASVANTALQCVPNQEEILEEENFVPPIVPPLEFIDSANNTFESDEFNTYDDIVPGQEARAEDVALQFNINNNSDGVSGNVDVLLSQPCMSQNTDALLSSPACENQESPSSMSQDSPSQLYLDNSLDKTVVNDFENTLQQDSTGLLEQPDELIPSTTEIDSNIESNQAYNSDNVYEEEGEICDISEPEVIHSDIDYVHFDTKGDNSQEDFSDNSYLLNSEDQLYIPSFIHKLRSSGSNTPETKSLGSMDDLSDTEYSVVKSRRRWSLVMAPQDLNLFGSVSSDLSLSLNESTISLISPEHLTSLLDSANDQMDQTGQSIEDEIVVVILNKKERSSKIGLELSPGTHGNVVISKIDPDSLAGSDGRIVPGDLILSVNGEKLTSNNTQIVMSKIENRESVQVVLVLSKPSGDQPPSLPSEIPPEVVDQPPEVIGQPPEIIGQPPEVIGQPPEVPVEAPAETIAQVNGNMSSDSDSVQVKEVAPTDNRVADSPKKEDRPVEKPRIAEIDYLSFDLPKPDEPAEDAEYEEFDVTMTKGVTGLGFLIEGGKASARGDVPLSIRRIFKGGPAEKCGQLKVKDQILMVNGEDLTNMRHSEAWQHLKFLDDGEVFLKIKRVKQKE